MSQRLISRNPDLKRLRDEGYHVEIISNHLVVHGIPYVRPDRTVSGGALVSTLHLSGEQTLAPDTHVAMFTGEYPCRADGTPIAQIRHTDCALQLSADVVARHSFSSKPANGVPYRDYHEKMVTYAQIISSQARAIEPNADARTHPVYEEAADDSVFNYLDTASSRAGISDLTAKLGPQKVAIIGVGGTGSYVLDLVSKVPVREIHLFDGDVFANHNAFRAPGAASIEDLRARLPKVEYLSRVYSRMHRKVIPHPERVTQDNLGLLDGLTFVFICIDDGPAKVPIIAELEKRGVPFIDVGMGLTVTEGKLLGQLRVTTSVPDRRDHVHVKHRIPVAASDQPDVYTQNIQIAELNALNAALAVVKWKKLCGFYLDLEGELHTVYCVDGNCVLNEDKA